jgi:hypothetical protein
VYRPPLRLPFKVVATRLVRRRQIRLDIRTRPTGRPRSAPALAAATTQRHRRGASAPLSRFGTLRLNHFEGLSPAGSLALRLCSHRSCVCRRDLASVTRLHPAAARCLA